MTNFEKINRQTDRLKKMLSILEKAKTKMGPDRFNKCMDELAFKSWKKLIRWWKKAKIRLAEKAREII